MAKNPTINSVSFDDLDKMYGADHFQDALADFIAHCNVGSNPTREIDNRKGRWIKDPRPRSRGETAR